MNKIIVILLLVISFNAFSAELIKDKLYRARTTIDVIDGSDATIRVGAQSKFVILNNDNKNNYAIKFMNIHKHGVVLKPKDNSEGFMVYQKSEVIKGDTYYLSKNKVKGVPIESLVQQSFGGAVSGPLIVPFKYRLNDKSIGGDATIGYYAGWGYETNFFDLSDTFVTFTPFLSAGITQVTVLSENKEGSIDTDSKSGFSWATGILIKNWAAMNIGIVYGQDRIGDINWEHEGEGWFSISVGWKI